MLRIEMNSNNLVLGKTRVGKSYSAAIPIIRQMNASYVVTDPLGTIFREVGEDLIKNRYDVRVLDLCDMKNSWCYNPFLYIRDIRSADTIVESIIRNTPSATPKFIMAERMLLAACVYYVRGFLKKKIDGNLNAVADMLYAGMLDLITPYNDYEYDEYMPHLSAIFSDNLENPEAVSAYDFFIREAKGEWEAVIKSCVKRLRALTNPRLRAVSQFDSMELHELGDHEMAIFIITPQSPFGASFLPAMLYAQVFETLAYWGKEREKIGEPPQSRVPVHCIMDEFTNFHVPRFARILNSINRYNVSITATAQNFFQIRKTYSDWAESILMAFDHIFCIGELDPDVQALM